MDICDFINVHARFHSKKPGDLLSLLVARDGGAVLTGVANDREIRQQDRALDGSPGRITHLSDGEFWLLERND